MIQYHYMSSNDTHSLGWGVVNNQGAEIWDAKPIFVNGQITWKDKLKLIFYPKRFLLFRFLNKDIRKKRKTGEKYRILDVGCGTGAAMVDMKRLWGKQVEVVGIDVVKIQVELAKKKLAEHGVWANVHWFDGKHIAFDDASFDAVYTSDVIGHVEDADIWLSEISRVLKPGGVLAMFAESKLGKHAWLRNYLMKRGLNTDPHAEFHISLFSKEGLIKKLQASRFKLQAVYTTVWAKFFVHPDELYPAFQKHGKFFFLRNINALFNWIKKKTAPYSLAAAELYSLLEMVTVGRWVESQGYIILARKK